MKRRFCTLDVFTDEKFGGNPLAVVWDSFGLSDERMQKIAREFNLSETVFLFEPKNPIHTAAARIFTPVRELPFAGHPTVGAAIAVARERAHQFAGGRDLIVVLEEAIGNISCSVRLEKQGADFCYFDLVRLPQKIAPADALKLAEALSLNVADIGFDAHEAGVWSAGTPFCFAPVKSLEAVARATPRKNLVRAAAAGGVGVFVYCRQTMHEENAVHARMFGAGIGIVEDPATGAAAAAFAGLAVAYEAPEDGSHTLTIEQGFEMGRPSLLVLGLQVESGVLISATIGGRAVFIAEGFLQP